MLQASGCTATYRQAYYHITKKCNLTADRYLEEVPKLESFFSLMKERDPDGTYTLWTHDSVTYTIEGHQVPGEEFRGFFVGWGWKTRHFNAHARPVIVSDACHSKSSFGGVILTLVTKDAGDSIILLGLGYVTIENKENWTWFMRQANNHLQRAFSNQNLVLIVDWEKGLNSVTELDFFDAVLSKCTKHAWKNLQNSVPQVRQAHKVKFNAIVKAEQGILIQTP